MSLEVVGDITGMWQESVQSVSTGLAGMGTQELADTTQRWADALDVLGGTAQIVSAAAALLTTRNAVELALAASEAGARAVNPLTWPMIALGFGAAAMTAAFVGSLTYNYTVKADLSTGSGTLTMTNTLGALT